jgi:hypothetical protein
MGGGQRHGKEWLAEIDGLLHGGNRYRVAAPDADSLTKIVGDAASPADARVGAAAALIRLHGEGRRAVRIAAGACAEPKVRAALLALGEAESDDAVAEVLERASAGRDA